MKLLALLLFTGLALSHAVPVPSYEEFSLDDIEDLDYLFEALPYEADDDVYDIKELLNRKLHVVLERILDRIENRQRVEDDLRTMMKEIGRKMTELGIGLNERSLELLERIQNKAKEVVDKFSSSGKSDDVYDMKELLNRQLHVVLERILDRIENRQRVGDDLRTMMKEIGRKMSELGIGFNERSLELLEKIKTKTKEFIDKYSRNDKRDLEEMKRDLREAYERILERIKEAIIKGNEVEGKTIDKLREIRQKLRDLRVDIGEKARELVKKLKEEINNALDSDKVREKIEEVFGKGSELTETLLKRLRKGGELVERILDNVDKLLGDKEEEKRSAKEVYERVKDYFRNLKIELKEKFEKFGEYAKEKYENVLENGRDRVENLRKLAREFINDARVISKDVAEQAKGFFREYREDLGVIYDEVKEKVRDILNRN